jgi:hypothetical protein
MEAEVGIEGGVAGAVEEEGGGEAHEVRVWKLSWL